LEWLGHEKIRAGFDRGLGMLRPVGGSELADMMTSGFTNVEQVHEGPTALQKLRGGDLILVASNIGCNVL
jgi:hypothetical protein